MESARPIQILTPTNHEFTLELQNLKGIFEKADIKDRFIVAIAIAGAFRKGKSFLLNYFLRYLYAQVSYKSIFKPFFSIQITTKSLTKTEKNSIKNMMRRIGSTSSTLNSKDFPRKGVLSV